MLYYFHFFEVQFSLLLNLWAFIYWVWFLCQVLNSDFQVSSEARGFLLSSDNILVLGGLAVAFLWILCPKSKLCLMLTWGYCISGPRSFLYFLVFQG